MHEHLSSDRLIGHHRARMDYSDSPVNTIQFAYGDQRYMKMTYELMWGDDMVRLNLDSVDLKLSNIQTTDAAS